MACGEVDARGDAGVPGFEPAFDAQAPVIAGLQAGEAIVRHGRAEIVAARAAEYEKFVRHLGADGVQADVTGAGIAASVTVPAREGGAAAGVERLAENIVSLYRHEAEFYRWNGPGGMGASDAWIMPT